MLRTENEVTQYYLVFSSGIPPRVRTDERPVNAHQNRDLVGLVATAETGEAACDNFDAAFGEPIAFFTALQIVSRENGFSRKSDIPSFSALSATALGS